MPVETVPCPGCAAPMLLDQEVCAACRRPRDAFEIAAGQEAVAARARRRRSLPLKLLSCAAAAAAAYAAYQARGPVLARLARERADMAAEMDRIADPAKRPGGAVPQTEMGKRLVAALGAPRPPEGGAAEPSSRTRGGPPPEEGPVDAAPADPPAVPRPAGVAHAPGGVTPPNRHKVYGVLYDLETGLTVPDAEIFVRRTSDSLPTVDTPVTRTGSDGFFEVDYGAGADWGVEFFLVVRRRGVELQVVDDSDPPYRERTAQMRREDLAALRDRDLTRIELHDSDGRIQHHDVVALPPVEKR